MKKIISLFILIFLLFFMVSCNSIKNEPYLNETNIKNQNSVSSVYGLKNNIEINSSENCSHEELKVDLYYDFYNILPCDDKFISTMKDNIIDKKITELFNDAVSTKAMEDAALKSNELWKEEMEYAINEIMKDLAYEHQEEFMEVQKKWEEYIDNSLAFDKSIIADPDNYATELQFKFPEARARFYRERTIKIKYLHYFIEENLGKSENEFKSLTFKNN